MKSISTILIAGLYLVFSTGLVIQHHFCGGKLEAINLYTTKACCADADTEKSCCQNSASIFKVKDGYDVASYSMTVLRHDAFVIADFSLPDHNSHVPGRGFINSHQGESLGSSPPIYLSNRVFLI